MQKSETHTLVLQKFSTFTSKRYVDPTYSYCAPDGKSLYYFYFEGNAMLRTCHLAMIDLESGAESDIYYFGENYNCALVGAIGLAQVKWTGNTLTFFLGEGDNKATRFSYDTEGKKMHIEPGLDAPPFVFYHEPLNENDKALMCYNLPADADLQHATVIQGTLYQTFAQGDKTYYRALNLDTKKECKADITAVSALFYGNYLLCDGETPNTKDLYTFRDNKLVCIASQLPKISPYVLMDSFNEFIITNAGFQKCFYVKEGVLNPLEVTLENPFQQNLAAPETRLQCIGSCGTTMYFHAFEEIDGAMYHYVLKGTIEPTSVPATS